MSGLNRSTAVDEFKFTPIRCVIISYTGPLPLDYWPSMTRRAHLLSAIIYLFKLIKSVNVTFKGKILIQEIGRLVESKY